ncbi:MAG: hypothetical protein ISS76_21345 [Phycisphaerae bacterium]|nr:hypothetical protein [Phycisphaerae bacterium]
MNEQEYKEKLYEQAKEVRDLVRNSTVREHFLKQIRAYDKESLAWYKNGKKDKQASPLELLTLPTIDKLELTTRSLYKPHDYQRCSPEQILRGRYALLVILHDNIYAMNTSVIPISEGIWSDSDKVSGWIAPIWQQIWNLWNPIEKSGKNVTRKLITSIHDWYEKNKNPEITSTLIIDEIDDALKQVKDNLAAGAGGQMKTSEANKSLTEKEMDFLKPIATDVAMLISDSDKYVSAAKKMKHFRKNLANFARKWEKHDTAYKAFCEDKWLPSMGKPVNPLRTIWPNDYGHEWEVSTRPRKSSGSGFKIPHYGNYHYKDAQLGDYALLGVIHDKRLTYLPSVLNGILPDVLIELIWQKLIKGLCYERRRGDTVETRTIEECLSRIKSDLQMLNREREAAAASGLGSPGITPPVTKDSALASQQKSVDHKEELLQKPKTKKQQWRDDAPDYMRNSEAIVNFTRGKMVLSKLTKLLNEPENKIRFMRKGRRCKVHIGDFRDYASQHYIGDKLADEIADERLAERDFQKAEEDCHKEKTGK